MPDRDRSNEDIDTSNGFLFHHFRSEDGETQKKNERRRNEETCREEDPVSRGMEGDLQNVVTSSKERDPTSTDTILVAFFRSDRNEAWMEGRRGVEGWFGSRTIEHDRSVHASAWISGNGSSSVDRSSLHLLARLSRCHLRVAPLSLSPRAIGPIRPIEGVSGSSWSASAWSCTLFLPTPPRLGIGRDRIPPHPYETHTLI